MRVAVATWTNRLAGGVETYLAAVVPALVQRGHHVAILHEVEEPAERASIVAATSVPQWSVARSGDAALESLRAWRPDVLFANGMDSAELERRTLEIAPAVLFAHAYRGTCISGTKSFRTPRRATCDRTLGSACLLHYLPRQCGGFSPVTMMRLYRRETHRRDLLKRYAAVAAFSEHIREEYVRHGVARGRTRVLPSHVGSSSMRPRTAAEGAPARILFVGRMEPLKGADLLLEALPLAEERLGRPLQARFVGDGRERARLEAQARGRVEFTGWVGPEQRDRLFAESDLLVIPSVWPEPFGLVGIEAASAGVPAAGFDVGGISQWLHDGVNGHLAAAHPPSAKSLANAMVQCLKDPAHHARLAGAAARMAANHTMQAHVTALEEMLSAAAVRRGASNDPAA